jgi:thymidine phosphorylase
VAVPALTQGIVGAIDGEAVGLAAMGLGAGRAKKDDVIDPGVGIILRRKVADRVGRGEALAEIHAPDAPRAEEAVRQVQAAYHIGHAPPGPRPLIHEVVR